MVGGAGAARRSGVRAAAGPLPGPSRAARSAPVCRAPRGQAATAGARPDRAVAARVVARRCRRRRRLRCRGGAHGRAGRPGRAVRRPACGPASTDRSSAPRPRREPAYGACRSAGRHQRHRPRRAGTGGHRRRPPPGRPGGQRPAADPATGGGRDSRSVRADRRAGPGGRPRPRRRPDAVAPEQVPVIVDARAPDRRRHRAVPVPSARPAHGDRGPAGLAQLARPRPPAGSAGVGGAGAGRRRRSAGARLRPGAPGSAGAAAPPAWAHGRGTPGPPVGRHAAIGGRRPATPAARPAGGAGHRRPGRCGGSPIAGDPPRASGGSSCRAAADPRRGARRDLARAARRAAPVDPVVDVQRAAAPDRCGSASTRRSAPRDHDQQQQREAQWTLSLPPSSSDQRGDRGQRRRRPRSARSGGGRSARSSAIPVRHGRRAYRDAAPARNGRRRAPLVVPAPRTSTWTGDRVRPVSRRRGRRPS